MTTFQYTVTDAQGVHARPAGLLVKHLASYPEHSISISKDGKSADAKRLFALMGLCIKCGDTITVTVDGADSATAAAALEAFLQETV